MFEDRDGDGKMERMGGALRSLLRPSLKSEADFVVGKVGSGG